MREGAQAEDVMHPASVSVGVNPNACQATHGLSVAGHAAHCRVHVQSSRPLTGGAGQGMHEAPAVLGHDTRAPYVARESGKLPEHGSYILGGEKGLLHARAAHEGSYSS